MRVRRTWRWHRMIDYLLPRRRDRGLHFWTNRGSKRAREVIVRPPRSPLTRLGAGGGFGGEQRRVTPRQTCPRPDGFGRNLRSKTRWFTGFCNSHQVSHFATFFIDARAEISVAESRSFILKTNPEATTEAESPFTGPRWRGSSRCLSLTHSAPGFVWCRGRGAGPHAPGEECPGRARAPFPPRVL